ncbi:TetR/AcrR family transcriptional regulator [Caulobacter segnis]|uniref:TetR/AcrR family transcriptional regulator n=1 Tax=Caulobacter segnis TaxID=88688 RepID=UPI00240F9103|nr:TetR/AcrR family transcriptional regulator [Caulobacter segnis]MDG2520657.1 TetR/AcrR family transcriptional regulator [Caulobacter segnis]
MTSTTRPYNNTLRREQADATRDRILDATARLLDEGVAEPTNRAVAERAGVTQVTLYRHFPSRQLLLQGVWAHLNAKSGIAGGMPRDPDDLRQRITPLFESFDAAPGEITARLTTPQGRVARASLDDERRAAFTALLETAAPTLDPAEQVKAAAVLQLLYSAYSWLSLREQWNLTGEPAAEAVGWAVDVLLKDLKSRGSEAIGPDRPSKDH